MVDINFFHGGNIYEIMRRYKRDVIDFSASINPLGLSSRAKKELAKNHSRILHYPDPEARDLVGRIARYWKIKEENILLGNGSSELIYLLLSALKPKSVAIPVPAFSEYERAAKSAGAKIYFLKLKEGEKFAFDVADSNNADTLFICNPNNPTGNLLLREQKIGNLPWRRIVVDEAFMDFLPDEKRHSFLWKAAKSRKIIVLRTFTKFFALPGLRIGYLVAHADLIRDLKRVCAPWNTNALAQLLAYALLGDRAYITKTRELIEKERGFLFDEIAKIGGLKPYPSVTNFLLIRIKDKDITSSVLTRRLIRKGILIRDCANFRGLGSKFVRIAIRLHKENLRLVSAMREVLEK